MALYLLVIGITKVSDNKSDLQTHSRSSAIMSFDSRYMIFSTRCNIYISHLCYDVSVHLSVRLSVTEVHCGHKGAVDWDPLHPVTMLFIPLHAWIDRCLCYLLTTPHPDRRMG